MPRLIKDAQDSVSNELIYFRSHAKATYMSDGASVEDAITAIDNRGYVTESELNAKGYLTSVPSEYVTESKLNTKGYVTQQDMLGKQDNLVSGTNIKTINGTSILGSGDIKVGYKTQVTTTSSSMTVNPNVYYKNVSTSLTSLTITLEPATDSTILNEYFVEFTTSSSGTTISLPATIIWANGVTPVFEKNTTYQISIINSLGVVTKFK